MRIKQTAYYNTFSYSKFNNWLFLDQRTSFIHTAYVQ